MYGDTVVPSDSVSVDVIRPTNNYVMETVPRLMVSFESLEEEMIKPARPAR